MNIGQNVRKHRRINGWTQAEMAIKCGLSRVGVSDIERGVFTPSIPTLLRIAKKMNVDIVVLIS